VKCFCKIKQAHTRWATKKWSKYFVTTLKISFVYLQCRNRHTTFSVLSRKWAKQPVNRTSVSGTNRVFDSPQHLNLLHSPRILLHSRYRSAGIEVVSMHDDDHSRPSGDTIKNAWSHASRSSTRTGGDKLTSALGCSNFKNTSFSTKIHQII